jgi:hypothetical protein
VVLGGGTSGVTYVLRFTYTDDSVPARIGTLLASITITDVASDIVVVENGTIVAGANALASVAFVDAYHGARGDTVWLTSAYAERQKAVIKATDYMEQAFRLRWTGSRVNGTQTLSWPRRGVYKPDVFDPYFRNANVPFEFRNTVFIEENVIPEEVQQCVAIMARETMTSAGVAATDLQPNLGRVTKREKLGDLEVEYFGADGGGQRLTAIYWKAANIVKPYLQAVNNGQSWRG